MLNDAIAVIVSSKYLSQRKITINETIKKQVNKGNILVSQCQPWTTVP